MVKLEVNGKQVEVDAEAETPLLWVLRDQLGLTGTKFGCGMRYAARARCTSTASAALVRDARRRASTARRHDDRGARRRRLRTRCKQAWLDGSVPQCGYCQAGQIMTTVALLAANPRSDGPGHRRRDVGNLCRCGTYPRIREASTRGRSADAGPPPRPQTARRSSDARARLPGGTSRAVSWSRRRAARSSSARCSGQQAAAPGALPADRRVSSRTRGSGSSPTTSRDLHARSGRDGQGTTTSHAVLVAEELELDPRRDQDRARRGRSQLRQPRQAAADPDHRRIDQRRAPHGSRCAKPAPPRASCSAMARRPRGRLRSRSVSRSMARSTTRARDASRPTASSSTRRLRSRCRT